MIVQHNIASMNANRQLGIVGNNLAKSTEKLSSGYRINRAADDAAGLSISEKMRGQVGANNGQSIAVSISETTMTAASAEVATHTSATAVIAELDGDITALSTQRSKLGAIQNRLEYTVKNDDNATENLQNAESRIRDVDMADEMTRFSKESILQQAATSMLAQANQQNQGVLSLLQ